MITIDLVSIVEKVVVMVMLMVVKLEKTLIIYILDF